MALLRQISTTKRVRPVAPIAVLLVGVMAVFQIGIAFATDGKLVQRCQELAEEYDRSEREAVDVDALLEKLVALVDDLEEAKMDSLAIDTIRRAQNLHTRRGELEEARALLARGIEIASRGGMRGAEATLTMSSAVTYAIGGDFESFIATAGGLIPVFEEIEDYHMAAVCWFNVGVAYTKLGRFPEALAAIEQSMSIAHRINDRRRLGSCYAMAAELNLNAGRLTDAAVLVDSAVTITREIGRAVPLGAALTVQGHVYWAQGDIERAIAAVEEAIDVREKIGDAVYVMMSKLQKALFLQRAGRPEECAKLVDSIMPRLREQGDATQLHSAYELRCQALFDMQHYDEAERLLVETILRFESDRETLREVSSQAGFFGTGGEYYATLARCFFRNGDNESAWAAVERGHGALLTYQVGDDSTAVAPERVGLRELQDRLADEDAALLQFNDPRMNPLLAFVVTGDNIEAMELPFATEIANDARSALDLMAAGSPDEFCDPVLERIAEALQAARLEELPQRVSRLYVIPPSSLAGFPFESLPITSRGECVGDRFAVSYVSSASWLVRVAPPTAHRTIVAFADPVVEVGQTEPDAVNSQFRTLASPLPHARDEVRVLAGADTRVHFGADATRTRLVGEDLSEAGVLHFATHAVVNPYAPERSCLLLAGPEGVLEASEVETLSLDADLVAMSGCETSGGFTYLGEGTFGLTRSFLVAGARSVVSSLWRVEDEAASRFMIEFYDHLRDGKPRDVSLLLARRAMRDEGYSHRDRSAFILTGVGSEPVLGLAALGPRQGRLGGLSRTTVSLLAVIVMTTVIIIFAARRRAARAKR